MNLRPNHVDPCPDRTLQALTNLAGLGPVASKKTVENKDFNGALFYRCVNSVEGVLGGGGDKAKNERRHRGDEPDTNLNRVSRLRVEVMFR